MQIRQSPLKGLWLPPSFLLLMWISVIIPSASPRYCLCRLRSQLGTVPKYEWYGSASLRGWQKVTVLLGTMYSCGPEQSCRVLHHVYARWCRQRRVLLSCFSRRGPCYTAIHQEAEQLQLAWPHPSENMYFWKISMLPWRICVMLTYHLPSARKMSKISLSLPANGNAVSDVFVFCVNQ